MKTILLFLFFILMTPAVNAQTTVTNNANCAVEVWVLCYRNNSAPDPPCCIVSEMRYVFAAGEQRVLHDCIAPFVLHGK